MIVFEHTCPNKVQSLCFSGNDLDPCLTLIGNHIHHQIFWASIHGERGEDLHHPGGIVCCMDTPCKVAQVAALQMVSTNLSPREFLQLENTHKKRVYFILSWKKEDILRTSAGKNGIITTSAGKKEDNTTSAGKKRILQVQLKKPQDNTTSVWKKRILQLQLDFSWKKEDIKTSRRKEEDNKKKRILQFSWKRRGY